jgi:membrane associated rhomboid family serine protease
MLPLGLGLPIHRVPVVTLSLVIACTVKFFTNDIYLLKKYEKKAILLYQDIEKSSELKNLKSEYCHQFANKKFECKVFTQNDDTSYLKNKNIKKEHFFFQNKFKSDIYEKTKKVTSLKSYIKYDRMLEEQKIKMLPFFELNNLLTFKTQSILNYFLGMFTHSSVSHLVGNMLTLLAFGIYVEAKIGVLGMTISYFLTGFISFYVYVNFFADKSTPLMGASGAICGIMGMFYVSFFRHYLKFWLWFKTFLLPVKTYFPFLFILTDFITHFGAPTNVAAMAHIAGMFSGISIMLFLSANQQTPYPFIYNEELRFFKAIKNKIIDREDVLKACYWLRINPINFLLREKLIISLWNNVETNRGIKKSEIEMLKENTRKFIGRSLHYKDHKAILKAIDLVPNTFSLAPFLNDFNISELVNIYNLCLKKEALISSIRVAIVLLERPINPRLSKTLIANLKSSFPMTDSKTLDILISTSKNNQLRMEVSDYIGSKNLKETA